jgi:hypothetical protein
MGIDEAFEDWLDGPSPTKEPRRKWINPEDLGNVKWGFTFGWLLGQEQALKDLQNV